MPARIPALAGTVIYYVPTIDEHFKLQLTDQEQKELVEFLEITASGNVSTDEEQEPWRRESM